MPALSCTSSVIQTQQLSQAASRQSPEDGSMRVALNALFDPRELNRKAHTLSVSHEELRDRKSRWPHRVHPYRDSCRETRVQPTVLSGTEQTFCYQQSHQLTLRRTHPCREHTSARDRAPHDRAQEALSARWIRGQSTARAHSVQNLGPKCQPAR